MAAPCSRPYFLFFSQSSLLLGARAAGILRLFLGTGILLLGARVAGIGALHPTRVTGIRNGRGLSRT